MSSVPPSLRLVLDVLSRAALPVALCCLAACGGAEADRTAEPAGAAGQLRALAAASTSAESSALLRVRAAGSVSEGVGASAVVRFNGKPIAAGLLTHGELLEYELWLPNGWAGGTLDIALENATGADGAPARNLTIDSVSLNGAELRPGDVGVVFDAGGGEAAFDGKGLAPAHRVISRNGALRFTIEASTRTTAAPPAGVYIDAQRGSDSQPGTFDRPWRTLGPLQALSARLPAGHGIFLRCDGVWRAALSLTAQQLSDGAVVAGYGPECSARRATLTGADVFAGNWQKVGAVWTRQLPAGTPKISQLFIDGQAQRIAQWPNAGFAAANAGLLQAGETTPRPLVALQPADTTSLADKDLLGATVQIRSHAWLIETRRALALRSGQIELDRAPDWPARAGRTYLLQDQLWMLDQPGEFFHDTVTQRLHLIAPAALAAADLNTLLVEGTVRPTALSITGRRATSVTGLALLAAADTGLNILDAPETKVDGIEASDNAVNGLKLTHSVRLPAAVPGSLITGSRFVGNGRYGIDAVGAVRTLVLGNHVADTGAGPQHQAGVIAGIANGAGGRTEGNRVENSAYIGIHFSSQDASQVLRNHVEGFCLRLTDCGGIYTWTGQANGALAGGAVVAGNRVITAPKAPRPVPKVQTDIIVGIYIDDHSHGVAVQDNLVAHAPMGVFVHNASRTRVIGNRIWLPSQTGLWASMDDASGDSMLDNSFTDNTVVPALYARAQAGQLPRFDVGQAVWFWHTQAGEAALAADRNLFARNSIVQLFGPMAHFAWLRGPAGDRDIDGLDWRALNNAERPIASPAVFAPLAPQLGPEKVVDGQFEQGLTQWTEYRDPAGLGGATLRLNQQGGCTDACVGFVAGSRGDLLGSRPFTMKTGAPHVYRWTATMATATGATVGAPYISRDGTPWDMMTDGQGFSTPRPRRAGAGETLHFEAYFIAKADAAARVNLQLETPNARVDFDAVSVREVLGYNVAALSELSTVAIAPLDREAVVGCTDLGWPQGCEATDLLGQAVSWPLRLPAGSARLLLRKDTSFRL
jgi:hypothetical protein